MHTFTGGVWRAKLYLDYMRPDKRFFLESPRRASVDILDRLTYLLNSCNTISSWYVHKMCTKVGLLSSGYT